VLITDLDMPGMTGLQLADEVLGVDAEIGIIVVTGAGDETSAQAALRLGAADYLIKPVDLCSLERAVQLTAGRREQQKYARTLRTSLEAEVERQTLTIREVTLGTLASFVNALEAKSPHFLGHSQSVADCAARMAGALELPDHEIESVRSAGLLHDIGMIAVPDYLLDKVESLESEEFEIIREHSLKGAQILQPLSHLSSSIAFVLEHHERLDGSGYPEGKEGDAISLGGMIVGLAEAWTAIAEARSYRDRLARTEALQILEASSGRWFPPELVQALWSVQPD
jgi:putative two-component system response regulator